MVPRLQYSLQGKYQLSRSTPFKYLVPLSSSSHFLAAKGDQTFYLFKISKNSVVDFYSNDIAIEYVLEDTLSGYGASLTSDQLQTALPLFSGSSLPINCLTPDSNNWTGLVAKITGA